MAANGIDLFSGAGGFTTGAQNAGVKVLLAANHWDAAVACHAANHPGVEHVQQDLAEMDWTLCPEADILLASPACQGFSQAGQPARKGSGGSHAPDPARIRVKGQRDRNTSWAVLAAADTLRPRQIVIENVVDMMTAWDGFDAWLGVLQAFGYSTQAHRINAIEYGGGQERERLVVTANLGGPAIELAPTLGLESPTIGDCLDADDAPGNRWNAIDSKPARMQPLMAKAQRQAGARCFWANVSESRGRSLGEHFPTATTQSGTQWCLLDGDRVRVLNPREIARSMSFPETYQLPRQRELAGKLLGNAIDVNMARGIVGQVLAAA
jgi:DNA (cytosine-5)-methyltransferase 1